MTTTQKLTSQQRQARRDDGRFGRVTHAESELSLAASSDETVNGRSLHLVKLAARLGADPDDLDDITIREMNMATRLDLPPDTWVRHRELIQRELVAAAHA